jgi:hypothetical protein
MNLNHIEKNDLNSKGTTNLANILFNIGQQSKVRCVPLPCRFIQVKILHYALYF